MKKLLCISLILVFVSGCTSSLVKKPAVDNIKTIAFISVYSNASIYDYQESKKKADSISLIKKIVNRNDDINDGNVQISAHALEHFSKQLSNKQWQVVPPSDVIQHNAYKRFVEEAKGEGPLGFINQIASSQWAVPPLMVYFPYEAVAPKQGVKHFGIDPKEKAKKRLAQLCKELGVDGVGIVYVDVAYQKPFINLSAGGLLNVLRSDATPKVSSEMVIINNKGEIALQTPPVKQGSGKRFEGKQVSMLRGGIVDFSGEEGLEVVNAFSQAIKKNVMALKATIDEEL